ncbi:hypothetical protein OXX59_001785 [Metschnikowia pulcherrima]
MPVISIPEMPMDESLRGSSSSFYESSSASSFDADNNLIDTFLRGDARLPSFPVFPQAVAESGTAKKRRHRLSLKFRSLRDKAMRKAKSLYCKESYKTETINGVAPRVRRLGQPMTITYSPCDTEDMVSERNASENEEDSSLENASMYSYEYSYQIPFPLFNLFQATALERYVVSRVLSRGSSGHAAAEKSTGGKFLSKYFASRCRQIKLFLLKQTAKQLGRSIRAVYRAYNFSHVARCSMNEFLDSIFYPPADYVSADCVSAEYVQETDVHDWPNAFDTSSSIEDLGSFHDFASVVSTEDSVMNDETSQYPASTSSKISESDIQSHSDCGTLETFSQGLSDGTGESQNEDVSSAPAPTNFAADVFSAPECATESAPFELQRTYEEARANIPEMGESAGSSIHHAYLKSDSEANAAAQMLQPSVHAQQAILCDTDDESEYLVSISENSLTCSQYVVNDTFSSIYEADDWMCNYLYSDLAHNPPNAAECYDDAGILSEHSFLENYYTSEMVAYIDENPEFL